MYLSHLIAQYSLLNLIDGEMVIQTSSLLMTAIIIYTSFVLFHTIIHSVCFFIVLFFSGSVLYSRDEKLLCYTVGVKTY